jgi:hypothetical protein
VLIEILQIVGPVNVVGEEEPITSENVVAYMRLAEEPAPTGVDQRAWDRKRFIGRLAVPLVKKLLAGDSYSSAELIQKLLELIEEKHILLQSDDPEMQTLLARRGWDGAVRSVPNRDFLMAIDANIGFNKTHAVIDNSLVYEVDLGDLNHPLGILHVSYENHAQGEYPCYQNQYSVGLAQEAYNINDCYWTYLRIYSPMGADLIASTPRSVPAGRTLRGEPVPARTDRLGNEDIPGVEVFGTLIVVPMGETLSTDFQLRLPASVVQKDPQTQDWTYRLTVQKQPGTVAVPMTLRLLLPQGMQVTSASHELHADQDKWTLNTDLRTDLEFEIAFSASE